MSKAIQERELSSKYKSYVSQIDKILKMFESTNDWADLIVPLGKLNKILENNSKYGVIPRKNQISKRLAQCLHYALPSGVHLKTLETFDLIFRSIGPVELASDLFIYTTGLFPLLGYAAIGMRPTLLSLFEKHLVPLGPSLKPAITGIIMALLPGLESNAEFSDRITRLLDSFCKCVDRSYFYTCLWECIHVSSSIRHAGLSYIASHYDRKQSMDDQIYLMGTNINLLVQSLCSSLEDTSPLVQRCLLDLLVSCFPIHKCQLPRSDISKVMVCSVGVLMRRDMSLSRRLVAWLMGTDINGIQIAYNIPQVNGTLVNSNNQQHSTQQQHKQQHHRQPSDMTYFNIFTRDLLIQAIKTILSHNDHSSSLSSSPPPLSHKPLHCMNVMISLLDRPEIVSTILSDLLLPILRSMYRDCVSNLKENVDQLIEEKVKNGEVVGETLARKVRDKEKSAASEVHKTASILFNHFDPFFIWSFIAKLYQQACLNSIRSSSSSSSSQSLSSYSSSPSHSKSITVTEFTEIFHFLIDKLSADTFIEAQSIHFPTIITTIISTITTHTTILPPSDIISSLKLANKILTKIIRYSQELPLMKQRLLVVDEKHIKPCHHLKHKTRSKSNDKKRIEIVGSSDDDKEASNDVSNEADDDNDDDDDDDDTSDSAEKGNSEATSSVSTESCRKVVFCFIDSYLNLFHALVHSRLLTHASLEPSTTSYLLQHSNKQASMYSFKQHLNKELLANEGNNTNNTTNTTATNKTTISTSNTATNTTNNNTTIYNNTTTPTPFTHCNSDQLLLTACRLLEKCLSIPTYDIHFFNTNIPGWFRSLLCLCCVSHNHFNTQFISLNCLFTLLIQWKTFILNNSGKSDGGSDTDDGGDEGGGDDGEVDMCSEIHSCYLHVLNDKTCFFKLVGESVWESMSHCISQGNTGLPNGENIRGEGGEGGWGYIWGGNRSSGNIEGRGNGGNKIGGGNGVNVSQIDGNGGDSNIGGGSGGVGNVGGCNIGGGNGCSNSSCNGGNSSSCGSGNEGNGGGSLLKHVELFNRIHQHSPHVWICEEVITAAMLSYNVMERSKGMIQFMKFWNCLREMKSLGRQKFDRCIIMLLDNLSHDNHLFCCLATDWVVTCFKDPSFVHLLEPVLKVLLHPDTSRVSVQHLNSSTKAPPVERTQSVELYEPPIVAVSNEGGHIVYHIDNKRPFKHHRKSQDLTEAPSTTEPLEFSSSKQAEMLIDQYLASHRPHCSSVNLHVNPYLTGAEGVRMGGGVPGEDEGDCGKEEEEMCFEDEEAATCSFDEPDYQLGSFHVVTSILNDVINNVINHKLNNTVTSNKITFDSKPVTPSTSNNTNSNGNVDVCPVSSKTSDMNSSTDFSDFVSCDVLQQDQQQHQQQPQDQHQQLPQDQQHQQQQQKDQLRIGDEVVLRNKESVGDDGEDNGGKNSDKKSNNNNRVTINKSNNNNDLNNNTNTNNNSIKSTYSRQHTRTASVGKHIHPLKSYILLYRRKYDHTRVLCALRLLHNMLSTNTKLIVHSLMNTHMNNKHSTIKIIPSRDNSASAHNLVDLFIRHKQSILGHDFHHSLPYDIVDTLNDSTYLELLLFVLIYFIRAFFSESLLDKITPQDLAWNRQVHVSCCKLLVLLFNQLSRTVQQSAKVAYKVSELLLKSKVQKTILYSIHSNVTSQHAKMDGRAGGFNIGASEGSRMGCDLVSSGVYMESFLSLTVSLVQLEEQIRVMKSDTSSQESLPREFEQMYEASSAQKNDHHLFLTGHSIIYQPILLDSIMHSLSSPPLPAHHLYSPPLPPHHLRHQMWLRFVERLMPHLSKASTKVLSLVILNINQHLQHFHQHASTTLIHCNKNDSQQQFTTPNRSLPLCTDHYSSLMHSLTSIYHYCVFESNLHTSDTSLTSSTHEFQKPSLGGQFVSGLVSALTFQTLSKSKRNSTMASSMEDTGNQSELTTPMLTLLPTIVTTCYSTFNFFHLCHSYLSSPDEDEDEKGDDDDEDDNCLRTVNVDKQWLLRVRQDVLELLNPVSSNYLPLTLASFSLIWNEHSSFNSYEQMVDFTANEQQRTLVSILQDLRSVSLQALLNAIKHIVKQPVLLPSHANKSKQMSLEAGMLRMLFEFTRQFSDTHHSDNALSDTCSRVVAFVREVFPAFQASSDHPALFVLISLLHYVLVKSPMMEEKKKDSRDLHEFTNRLLESCSGVVAMSLEQGTFFRRSLAVKSEAITLPETAKDDDSLAPNDQTTEKTSILTASTMSLASRHFCKQSAFSLSVQALHVLADVAATLLDVVYQSDEKEKVVPLLSNILFNVFPFLRNHRISNSASYAASSRLLANLSGYQYSRRSWRKECLELLVDASFFQADLASLTSWVTIVDNLMSHDKSSFQDLLARFSLTQSSSLNLFSSRDGEMEVRRQLIKRMSFAVFCSETDQYSKSITDIQDKLSESLRFSNYPLLQAEVFNCFRVLLLKMTSFPLAPLWPIIINEVTQVLISMESKMETLDNDDLSRNYQTTDLLVSSDDKTNCLYVSVCKLLDLLLTLPPEHLPRFQLYKWTFVGDPSSEDNKSSPQPFVPHALKIAKLMQKKYGPEITNARKMDRSMLVPSRIESLRDLQEFFVTVCQDCSSLQQHQAFEGAYKSVSKSQSFSDFKTVRRSAKENSLESIKQSILLEFLEKMT